MKQCTHCREVYPTSEFYGRQSWCRDCLRKSARARNRAQVQWLREYKLKHSCVDCGETDPDVLEFDHRDPGEKSFWIAAKPQLSRRALLAEIAKCDVRCRRCHVRRTRALGHHRSPTETVDPAVAQMQTALFAEVVRGEPLARPPAALTVAS